jgi:aerobic-type carbon monoxide dehydrogenase small subunit (CoxS/CutS family)
MKIAFTCNGTPIEVHARADASLLEVLRDLGLTGAKVGCELGVCGLCTVLVNDLPVSSCIYLAPCAEDRDVWTIEGLATRVPELIDAFVDAEAMQCGICTPGQVISAFAAAAEGLRPASDELKAYLSGNLCRCTGYQTILDAIGSYLARR